MKSRKTRKIGVALDGKAWGYAPSFNFVAALVAIVGFFAPIMMFTPVKIAVVSGSMVADVGNSLTASVPSNPYNSLAEQLRAKELALNEREQALNSLDSSQKFSTGEIYGFISIVLSLVLCILIALNFYLDWTRRRKPRVISNNFSVDLRSN